MAKQKEARMASDRELEMFSRIMRHGFGMMEMGEWGLSESQFELATRCSAYKELMRQAHEHQKAGRPDDLIEVAKLAAASRRTDAPDFGEWRRDGQGGGSLSEAVAEDRGEAGWFADWELAAWYVHELDPETFTIDEVCYLLY